MRWLSLWVVAVTKLMSASTMAQSLVVTAKI